MVIDFGVKKYVVSKASNQKAWKGPSTLLIKPKRFIERLNVTIRAEECSFLSSYQTLSMDKNWQNYLSPMKLVKKWTLMSIQSSSAISKLLNMIVFCNNNWLIFYILPMKRLLTNNGLLVLTGTGCAVAVTMYEAYQPLTLLKPILRASVNPFFFSNNSNTQ